MKKLYIDSEFITLTQFLKMESFISSGGEAKYFLAEEEVYLNGELENRRGKKIYHGDFVLIRGEEYQIINEN
ncbi:MULTISPECIES: S4 domain-containing protein YaaA [unclassified Gemella]|uniref:S4 domain-containing protein YaaA n=1 Tax=unclassified Gemella TaxID=2624949 RepID=UPI001073F7AA|nr:MULTISPECIES: S4 domain-containing protein YaaA [unclassified Gemella]MBF0709624.1 S4 domain-containing protein YaaA [Gemella sp. GL1.1]MBF0746957.1 S4 domain-containing protein YaaA [Gemella sp. 19428wG2_WT2a]NYS26968.1 S4 domain-containing protein YaaA [Gemella sp. GL1]TFU59182.1 S4 domain-containing protein YaaA [Gemella sp. WT2a]